jgi:hypothetical protein
MQISNILNGWQNFLAKSEVTELLAEHRAVNCLVCPYLKKGKLLAFIKDDLKEIEGHYCDLCKCPLSAKIRSENETCPLGEW